MIRQLLRALGPEGARPLIRLLVLLTAAGLLQGISFALLVPVLRTLLGARPDDVWPWFAALCICSLLYLGVQTACLARGFTVGSAIARTLHHRIADTAGELPVGWFTPSRTAELGTLATGNVVQVMNMPAHLLRPLTAAVLTPATIAVATFFFDWRIGVTLLVCVPVLATVQRWSTNIVQRLDESRDAASAQAAERVVEFARNQPVLRAFGRTTDGYQALDDSLATQARTDHALILRGMPGLATFAFAARMVLVLVLAVSVRWQLGGTMDAPTLIALAVLTARLVDSVSGAADLGAGLRTARSSLNRMNRVLEEKPFPQPVEGRRPAGTSVRFTDVRFGYPGTPGTEPGATGLQRPTVLNGITLELPSPGLTALVGPSGAGKTTVAALLARFWDPDSGTVRIGDVDLREIAPEDLASLVSFVFQDVFLFSGTIEDNVRLGDPTATHEQLHRAARLAGLDSVVAELTDGWATRVGEGGAALSGGQRQRVSLARALLKDAPIFVLDEATAALDPENERIIDATVNALAAHKTLLVIAHRLHTVQAADQILVLEQGRISERGSHPDLLAADGTYAAFWRHRVKAEGWRLTALQPGGLPA